MRVKLEYGNSCRGKEVDRTEVVETDNFFQLYCTLKREFLKPYTAEEAYEGAGTPNCTAEDYLNEFSEIDEEEESAFYIGFEEGEYIEGWILI